MSKNKSCPWQKSTRPDPANLSSQNALKHGCCAAATLLLPHENESDYKSLENTWLKAFSPQSEPERKLVQELVNADWLLQRSIAAYVQVEASLYTQHPNPASWTVLEERKLARHLRYRTANTNLVLKARKAIEGFRKNRLNEKIQAEKQTIAHERLNIYKSKNRPEPNWKEHLEAMKEKAIALGFTPQTPPSNLDPAHHS